MTSMSLLEISITGGALILFITVLRALALDRLPKWTFLSLWGLALFRLLVPVAVPSPLSIQNLAVASTEAVGTLPALPSTPPAPTGSALPAAPVVSQAIPWTAVWVAGMVVCVLCFAVVYIRCRREFAASLPVTEPLADRFLAEHPLHRRVSIRQSDQIGSPLTYGVFSPVILLPKSTDWSDERAMECVLTHELVHIRRLDALWKLLLAAAVCIHWFNPLAWVLYILANRDLELSCDQRVLHRLNGDQRAAYALTLIALEERKSGPRPFCSSFGKNAAEERITAIMRSKKTTLFSLLLAALVITGAVAIFTTSANATENQSPLLKKNKAPVASIAQTPTDSTLTLIQPSVVDTAAPEVKAPVTDIAPEVQAPAADPVQAPATTPVQAPVADPVQAPATTPVQAPAADPVQAPATTPVQAPVSDLVQAPASNDTTVSQDPYAQQPYGFGYEDSYSQGDGNYNGWWGCGGYNNSYGYGCYPYYGSENSDSYNYGYGYGCYRGGCHR